MAQESIAFGTSGEREFAVTSTRGFKAFAQDRDILCAQITAKGGERFNFPQLVTLHPGVGMRTRPYWCPELESLAVNLLLHSKPAWKAIRESAAARRVTRPYAEIFAMQCLAPFAGHTWMLSTETVRETVAYLSAATRRATSRRHQE